MPLSFVRGALVFLLLFAFGVTVSADQKQQFFALDKEDLLRLEKQRAFVQKTAAGLRLSVGLVGSKADLAVLQSIVDSGRLQPNQTWELQSLGVVLGDIFAREHGLRWVIVVDEYGRDPALRYKKTSNLVFPLTMISKRLEEGKKVDLKAIYAGVSDYVAEFSE